MSRDRKIVAGAFIALLILMAANFEIADTMPVNTKKKYNAGANTPLGLSVFHTLLQGVYGADHVKIVNTLESIDTADLKTTLVFRFGDFYEQADELVINRVNDGLNMVIASHEIYFYTDSFSINTEYRNVNNQDTLQLKFLESGKKNKSYTVLDTLIQYPKTRLEVSNYSVAEEDGNDEYEKNKPSNQSKDTAPEVKQITKVPEETSYTKEQDTTALQNAISIDSHYLPAYKTLITSDSNKIALEKTIGEGKLLVHCFPRLFTNLGALESQTYADHLNYILSRFDVREIYLLREHELISGEKSKFSIILANRGTRAAYFTCGAGILLFLLFGLKRRMRPVPITAKKENTTIQYVGILARLYQSQNMPSKLVKQMKKNFDDYVFYHYHLSSNQLQFIEMLSRKSKIDYNLIQSIYRDFERFENERNVEEIKLITLHNKLEKFKRYANH